MNIRVLKRVYPKEIIKRIVEKQMRLTTNDAELYDNAMRVVCMAFDIASDYTDRQIVVSELEVGLKFIQPLLTLHIAPVNKIISIKYLDEANEIQALNVDSYNLVTTENSTRIEFLNLPKLTPTPRLEKVVITLQCGYADFADAMQAGDDLDEHYRLPGGIEAAVQLTAGTLFEADGEAIIGRSVSQLPLTAQNLLNPYRLSPYYDSKI